MRRSISKGVEMAFIFAHSGFPPSAWYTMLGDDDIGLQNGYRDGEEGGLSDMNQITPNYSMY